MKRARSFYFERLTHRTSKIVHRRERPTNHEHFIGKVGEYPHHRFSLEPVGLPEARHRQVGRLHKTS
jgi:hypothetical protein